MRILVIVALALCAFSSQVQARCTCQCVDGQTQALCSTTLDISRRPAWGYAARSRLQSPQSIRRESRHWAQHPADRSRFATSPEIAAGNRSADNFELGTDGPTITKEQLSC
jgi:hypothetical protein